MSDLVGTSRRQVLWSLAGLPATLLAAGPARAEVAASCRSDDEEALRISLNYMETSPHAAARNCGNCEFWVAAFAGAACGECTLVGGSTNSLLRFMGACAGVTKA